MKDVIMDLSTLISKLKDKSPFKSLLSRLEIVGAEKARI